MKLNRLSYAILFIIIIFILLFVLYKRSYQISNFTDIQPALLDKSLFIAYSTTNYEPVTAIWRQSLQENNITNIDHKVDDDSHHTSFGFQTDSWYTFVIKKIEHLINILSKYSKMNKYNYFIFTDCDIQYFNKNKIHWNHLHDFIKNNDKHIYFMREGEGTDVNTGFYIIKNDNYIDTLIDFFKSVIETSKVTSKKDAPLGDQSIINSKKHNIEFDYIPNEFIAFGETIYDKATAIIHHAINTKTKEEKIEQMNKIAGIINLQ